MLPITVGANRLAGTSGAVAAGYTVACGHAVAASSATARAGATLANACSSFEGCRSCASIKIGASQVLSQGVQGRRRLAQLAVFRAAADVSVSSASSVALASFSARASSSSASAYSASSSTSTSSCSDSAAAAAASGSSAKEDAPLSDRTAATGVPAGGGAVRPFVEFVASAARTQSLVDELLQRGSQKVAALAAEASSPLFANRASLSASVRLGSPAVAMDFEGVRLGRFGRMCVTQLATSDGGGSDGSAPRLMLFDAIRPGIVEALAPLLESPDVAKVVHDCREDSSALFHQYGVELRTVFDTQAAYATLERYGGRSPHQTSSAELCRQFLDVEEPQDLGDMKTSMMQDEKLWARRPLSSLLARYALQGVVHLLPLREALLHHAEWSSAKRRRSHAAFAGLAEEMAAASERNVQYRHLNETFATPTEMAKIGTLLWAHAAARTSKGVYLKLNAGRVGLANTASAVSRFADVQLGDAVLCCVSGVSIDGRYIYLDRYDHDWDYFDHQRRPSGEPEVGTFGRETRHKSSLDIFADQANLGVDPLLVRALPAADVGAEGMDEWEADPEDVGMPETVEEQQLQERHGGVRS
eukprot:TRINITY_DN55977_c0_g1_i1.p1 TRINITY_DN55977_c0_g1~~TRINITY_DN55977_c0_g1_i1.p1  ORF type:complete len:610 (-),score=115.90 TRINITY_DN55977_c0_g1_i1:42-1808(-)